MSYASEVKEEMLGVPNESCCELSQARGLLLFGREFSPSGISLLTENGGIAEAYANAVRLFSGCTPEIRRSESGNYKVSVADRGVTDAVIGEGMSLSRNEKKQLSIGKIERECCRAAFVRGAFLAGGTVTNPDVEYHLEFSCPSKNLATELQALLLQLGIASHLTKRAGAHVVYIKKSGDIEDLLGFTGATETAMMLMGSKMYKDVRNTVNRKCNFEKANISRSITAAVKQTDAIRRLREAKALDGLPAQLREIALLRLENPDATTEEIRRMLSDPLSISGVNHRFKKLIELSEELPQ